MLVAGELELIARDDVDEQEKKARFSIVKTICYHKLYLNDEELREGYDQIMKRIERGTHDWDEALGEHLHELLNYRANVILREKVNEGNHNQFTKVEGKKAAKERKAGESGKERFVYCMDFNNGSCTQRDHHEGKFNGVKVTKFHVCRKCHGFGEMKSHREGDPSCPRKEA